MFKNFWKVHKRKSPLLKEPSVRESVIAIVKASCEYLTARTLYHLTDPLDALTTLGLNALLIFIPLSVRCLDDDPPVSRD